MKIKNNSGFADELYQSFRKNNNKLRKHTNKKNTNNVI